MTTDPTLIPANEEERLAAVRRYDVLDSPADGAFDRVTRLAARHFGVPISIVSIVDTDRIWFKSHHGVDVDEIGRDPGLCASAILGDKPWVVENAEVDPRTMANPLVAGELGLRFYAGAPLRTGDGYNLGTLCVIDQEPREFSSEDAEVLSEMAEVVVDELELRLSARRTVQQELALRRQAEHMATALQSSLLPPELPKLEGAELASLYLPADASEVGGDFFDAFTIGETTVLAVGDVSGKGPRAAAVTGVARSTIRSASLWATGPGEILDNLNRTMLLGRKRDQIEHFCTVLLAFVTRAPGGLRLRLGSAGHAPALIVRGTGACEEAASAGAPVGWHADALYEEVAVELAAGDLLVMYTDGLSEARTPGGLLGPEGVTALLRGATSAEEAVDALRRPIEAGDVLVKDDVAALAVRVT